MKLYLDDVENLKNRTVHKYYTYTVLYRVSAYHGQRLHAMSRRRRPLSRRSVCGERRIILCEYRLSFTRARARPYVYNIIIMRVNYMLWLRRLYSHFESFSPCYSPYVALSPRSGFTLAVPVSSAVHPHHVYATTHCALHAQYARTHRTQIFFIIIIPAQYADPLTLCTT